jgi:hypothetical protein
MDWIITNMVNQPTTSARIIMLSYVEEGCPFWSAFFLLQHDDI